MCDTKKSSNAVFFGLGALLGAGAGLLMSTKQGRKYTKDMWKKVQPFIADTIENTKDEYEEVKTKAEETVSKAKDFAQDLPTTIRKPLKKTFFKGL